MNNFFVKKLLIVAMVVSWSEHFVNPIFNRKYLTRDTLGMKCTRENTLNTISATANYWQLRIEAIECNKVTIEVPECDFRIETSFSKNYSIHFEIPDCTYNEYYCRLSDCIEQKPYKYYANGDKIDGRLTTSINFKRHGPNSITFVKQDRVCRLQIALVNFAADEYVSVHDSNRVRKLSPPKLYDFINFANNEIGTKKSIDLIFHKTHRNSYFTILQFHNCH